MQDDTSFQRLEKKVGEAISMIQILRTERDELAVRRQELADQMRALEDNNQKLEQELERVRTDSVPREDLEQRKAEIQRRVAALLDRFDELNEPGQ